MKKYTLLTVVILALVFGAPAIIGIKAEARYQLVIDRVQQSGLNLVAHSYARGWFGSTAETTLELVKPEGISAASGKPGNLRLTLLSTISHGPLVSSGLGLAEINSEIKFGDKAIFPPDYPAEIYTLVKFGGEGHTRINLPATEIPGSAEMPDLSFGGLSGDIKFDIAHRDIDIRVVLQSLTALSAGQKLVELGETRLSSSSRTGVSGLTLGDAEFTVQQLMLSDSESGEQIAIHKLAIDMESAEESEQVSAVTNFRMERIEAGGDRYGPGLLRVELSRLAGPALVRLQQAVKEIKNQAMSDAQRSMALLGMMMDVGADLLKNDPSIVIKPLRLVTPEGTLLGEFSLRGDGLSLADISNIPVLISKLVADLSLRVPEKLFRAMLIQQTRRKVEQQIATMIEQGGAAPVLDQNKLQQLVELQVDEQLNRWLSQQFVERDGDHLATVASLSSGLLTVNGKSIPLSQ